MTNITGTRQYRLAEGVNAQAKTQERRLNLQKSPSYQLTDVQPDKSFFCAHNLCMKKYAYPRQVRSREWTR